MKIAGIAGSFDFQVTDNLERFILHLAKFVVEETKGFYCYCFNSSFSQITVSKTFFACFCPYNLAEIRIKRLILAS